MQNDFVGVCAESPESPESGSSRQGEGSGAAHGSGKAKPSPCSVERAGRPPADSAMWGDQKPVEGTFYKRSCTNRSGVWQGGIVDTGDFMFVPDGEEPPEVTVDPAEVAQMAVDKMLLARPKIRMSPKPGGEGLVGMPVWLAVDESSKTSFGPNSASASAGGVTVTATARVARAVWKLGDGATRTCTAGQMKPYQKSYGMADSACGHRYRSLPDGAAGGRGTYTVTATAHWDVDWQVEGSDESGELDQTRTSQAEATIRESQAVN